MKRKVLFVCPSNSLHSVIAEALLKRLDSKHFEAASAGLTCANIHPFTVEVLKEIGTEVTAKRRTVFEALQDDFDYVITFGDPADWKDISMRGAEHFHWRFDNPLAQPLEREEGLRLFRAIRDQIAQRLNLFTLVVLRPVEMASSAN